MAGKKKVVKNKVGNIVVDTGEEMQMPAELIKSTQALIKAIGSGERRGFIYVGTTDGKKVEGTKRESEGCIFIAGTSKYTVVMNLMANLEMSPLKVALMSAEDHTGHDHD